MAIIFYCSSAGINLAVDNLSYSRLGKLRVFNYSYPNNLPPNSKWLATNNYSFMVQN